MLSVQAWVLLVEVDIPHVDVRGVGQEGMEQYVMLVRSRGK